ncbi:hypothetical protein PR048_003308 [Dryococelus australis]|uniref:Uncharacterized protein n=1 Tax=Dryococelus australis TaxID=614101 RepID=A0ABQ9IML6_9NEOP|nr:hypothetical protein PR048_003308 [Dryococelus australis]
MLSSVEVENMCRVHSSYSVVWKMAHCRLTTDEALDYLDHLHRVSEQESEGCELDTAVETVVCDEYIPNSARMHCHQHPPAVEEQKEIFTQDKEVKASVHTTPQPVISSHLVGKDGTKWKIISTTTRHPGRLPKQNVLQQSPEPTPYAKRTVMATNFSKFVVTFHQRANAETRKTLHRVDNTWCISLNGNGCFHSMLGLEVYSYGQLNGVHSFLTLCVRRPI